MTKLDEALGLFPSCIKSGEDWSPECQAVLDAAKAELTALRAAARPAQEPVREALDALLAFRHGDMKHLTQDHARVLYAAQTGDVRSCAKCGEPTKSEEAWVDGQIWCHPCADAATGDMGGK